MAFPYNTHNKTIDIAKPTNAFCDFYFKWNENENQTVQFTITENDAAYDLSGYFFQFRINRIVPGQASVNVMNVLNADITLSTNVVSFSIDNADIPAVDSYEACLICYDDTDWNQSRVLAKGNINVSESLY